jgi:hypothetical protein
MMITAAARACQLSAAAAAVQVTVLRLRPGPGPLALPGRQCIAGQAMLTGSQAVDRVTPSRRV